MSKSLDVPVSYCFSRLWSLLQKLIYGYIKSLAITVTSRGGL
jgi:hypothetical protein